jgi:divalent metal cation (Fe/Co/Zn/Cd) transporter
MILAFLIFVFFFFVGLSILIKAICSAISRAKCKKENMNIVGVRIINNSGERTTFEIVYNNGECFRETVPANSWRYTQLIGFVS